MVVFDEVSTIAFEDADERIDPVLYPNLAALARDATWFRYATAPTDMTGTATPTILTGTVAERYHPPILSSYPRNLFTLLGRRYRMKVSQEATDLCPRDLCEDASGESAAARDRALASDLGLVYLHVIAPEGIERDLPLGVGHAGQLRRRHGHDRGRGLARAHRPRRGAARAGRRASGALRELRPLDRSYGAADPLLQALAAAARAVPVLPGRPPLPHPAARRDPRARRRAVVGQRIPAPAGLPASPAPGRLRRPPARHAPAPPAREGPLRPGADRRHGRQRRELPAPQRQPAPRHRRRRSRTSPTRRSSSSARSSTPAASPTATYGPRTSFPRSPTCSGSACRGAWTASSVFDSSAQIPSDVDVFMRSGRRLTPFAAGVQAPHPGVARAQDSPLRRTWPVTRPVRDRPPSRSDRTARHRRPPRIRERSRSTTRARTPRCTALRLPARPAHRHHPRLGGPPHARPGGRVERPDRRRRSKLHPRRDDAENFSIMLPETAFREGLNHVELLSVAEDGGGLRLTSLARAG